MLFLPGLAVEVGPISVCPESTTKRDFVIDVSSIPQLRREDTALYNSILLKNVLPYVAVNF